MSTSGIPPGRRQGRSQAPSALNTLSAVHSPSHSELAVTESFEGLSLHGLRSHVSEAGPPEGKQIIYRPLACCPQPLLPWAHLGSLPFKSAPAARAFLSVSRPGEVILHHHLTFPVPVSVTALNLPRAVQTTSPGSLS